MQFQVKSNGISSHCTSASTYAVQIDWHGFRQSLLDNMNAKCIIYIIYIWAEYNLSNLFISKIEKFNREILNELIKAMFSECTHTNGWNGSKHGFGWWNSPKNVATSREIVLFEACVCCTHTQCAFLFIYVEKFFVFLRNKIIWIIYQKLERAREREIARNGDVNTEREKEKERWWWIQRKLLICTRAAPFDAAAKGNSLEIEYCMCLHDSSCVCVCNSSAYRMN